MRPEKAKRIVSACISRALSADSFAPLIPAKRAIEVLLRRCVVQGDDEASYYLPQTSISTLGYISDRFVCSGRLRWMLVKIERVSQLPYSRAIRMLARPQQFYDVKCVIGGAAMSNLSSEQVSSDRLKISAQMPVSLHSALTDMAERECSSVHLIADQLLRQGLVDFDTKTMYESPCVVLKALKDRMNNYPGQTVDVVVPTDRRVVMRTSLRAGEYSSMVSEFASLMIIAGLSHESRS